MTKVSEGVTALAENRNNEQYFFTEDTINSLAELCKGKGHVAFLFTPTVAEKFRQIEPNTYFVVLDIDPRLELIFDENFKRYDANHGIHSKDSSLSKILSPLEYKFGAVIMDPPYAAVSPEVLAKNANALLVFDQDLPSTAYVAYPETGETKLIDAFKKYGMVGSVVDDITVKYMNPPKMMERKKVKLYRFVRSYTSH